ncbi:hybrid sensor histidine kinase/response regulator [Treponema brennaborense]|uniref:histidine kinase n=1 Tax=Treponema brennaborense (strain DSM 12168 / CIP 105900 / DD5/3) TaxID=906968 RepID=F4LK40_TREBD|nr:hybrid sensor histidine kinase/response regulator [Treponema brennaborense]AEE17502.1 Hpt sensor hybrid histidine kinase [Treponema brennaborense DSM 12168]
MQPVQSSFLASTLHEIRTPIQTILGTAELLQETQLDPEQQEYVRQIAFSADVLYTLANEILDFEKIRTGSMQIEYIPCAVGTLTEQIVDLLCIEAHNKGLELVTDIADSVPETIIGDPVRIQQILLNLVKNAVKFTQSGYVAVKVSARKGADGAGTLSFQVIDSGIGVSDSAKKLIFKEFVQADASTTRKYGGTGLGLAISTRLAALMNGKITVTDNEDGGAVFTFTLPYERPADAHQADVHPAAENPADVQKNDRSETRIVPDGFRILLVDDSRIALESMRNKIRRFGGTDVETAASGEEALQKLRAAHQAGKDFAVAFIDMIMPVMDGWRLSADINSDITINGTKLFLMIPEGAMGRDAKMKLLDWFNGYLYKPVKMQMLEALLKDAVADPLELPPADIPEKPPVSVEELPVAVEELPVAAEEPRNAPAPQKTEPSVGCSVLAVEDHPVNRKIITTFLSGFGAVVYTAENGREAIRVVREHPDISIVFMDIQMPVMNGLDAAVALRKQGYPGIIIACTANSDPADFREYGRSGMDDTLVKPFKKQTLKAMLDKWTGAAAQTAALQTAAPSANAVRTQRKQPLWDKTELLKSFGNDEPFIADLIREYMKQTDSLLTLLRAGGTPGDADSSRRAAHTLKGSSAAIYARPLAQSAERLEQAYKDGNAANADALLAEFGSLYAAFAEEFRSKGKIS